MPPTQILILSDGRPGHVNLSEGIAAALEHLGPAETRRLEIRRGRWPGAVLAGLSRSPLPPNAMLRLVYGLDDLQIPAAGIVVSAGAETLAASVWLARARQVPNVFYGSLRLFDPADFALVLTSYAANAALPRHALTLKPSRLDPGHRRQRRPAEATPPSAAGQTVGLLIGGDAGPIAYREADWTALLELVERMARESGTRWLVANSRRTPDPVSDALSALAGRADGPIATFLDVRTAGAGTLAGLLLDCDAVICTADSSSMISECVWAQLPTVAVSPATFELTPNERDYRDWISAQGWLRTLPLPGIAPEPYQAAVAGVTPMRHNPLHALAGLLQQRLGLPAASR